MKPFWYKLSTIFFEETEIWERGRGRGAFANILPLFRISLFLHLFEHYLFKFNEQRIIRVYDVVGDFLCGLVIIMM